MHLASYLIRAKLARGLLLVTQRYHAASKYTTAQVMSAFGFFSFENHSLYSTFKLSLSYQTTMFVIQHKTRSMRIPRADGNQMEKTRIISTLLRDAGVMGKSVATAGFLLHPSKTLHSGLFCVLRVGHMLHF